MDECEEYECEEYALSTAQRVRSPYNSTPCHRLQVHRTALAPATTNTIAAENGPFGISAGP
eukprot:30273-Eustigmatos_ZCMA.PRE.1